MATITTIGDCPYSPGSNRAERFALFKVGMDEASHQSVGGRGKDWKKAVELGAISVDGSAIAVGRAPRAPRTSRATPESGEAATEQGYTPEAAPRGRIPPAIPGPPAGLLPGHVRVVKAGYRKSKRRGGDWDDHILTATDDLGDPWYCYVSSEALAVMYTEKARMYGIIPSQWKRG